MYPQPISSQEVYGKHRNADDIREIERQNQVLEARSYRYGDPVNQKAENDEKPAKSRLPNETFRQRRYNELSLLTRVIFFFLPFLGNRSRI